MNEIPFIYKNEPGVERAMRDAEEAVFGRGGVAMYGTYYGGGASRLSVWWYPIKYAPQVEKMHEYMKGVGLDEMRMPAPGTPEWDKMGGA